MVVRCSSGHTRAVLRQLGYSACARTSFRRTPIRSKATDSNTRPATRAHVDIDELLSKPTWSVRSLLPPKTPQTGNAKVSSKQLHHLLRLSALPLPETPGEEQKMLDTLSAQLHFVGEMQKVDTEGVAPLRAIRDESPSAINDHQVTLDTLKQALGKEDAVGKHHKRIRRRTDTVDAQEAEGWDVLGSAEHKAGNYFVVESERP